MMIRVDQRRKNEKRTSRDEEIKRRKEDREKESWDGVQFLTLFLLEFLFSLLKGLEVDFVELHSVVLVR